MLSKNMHLHFFVLLVLVLTCNITPAFAAGAPAGMFPALDQAFRWVRNILLVCATVNVVSYAFFFFVAGGAEGERKVAEARKKLLVTCIACASLSLLPSVMIMGKSMVSDMKWKPGDHMITPADTADKGYADVSAPVDPSDP